MEITQIMTPETAAAVRGELREILASPNPPQVVTVLVKQGVYAPKDFRFTAEDCSADTRVVFSAEAGAIIHGGVTVERERWQEADAAMLARIPAEARDHVRMISLTA